VGLQACMCAITCYQSLPLDQVVTLVHQKVDLARDVDVRHDLEHRLSRLRQ
jgi:hypothetical protein